MFLRVPSPPPTVGRLVSLKTKDSFKCDHWANSFSFFEQESFRKHVWMCSCFQVVSRGSMPSHILSKFSSLWYCMWPACFNQVYIPANVSFEPPACTFSPLTSSGVVNFFQLLVVYRFVLYCAPQAHVRCVVLYKQSFPFSTLQLHHRALDCREQICCSVRGHHSILMQHVSQLA